MAITFSTPTSQYNSSHFLPGEEVVIHVTLDDPSEFGAIRLYDGQFQARNRLPYVPSYLYEIAGSGTEYTITYQPVDRRTGIWVSFGGETSHQISVGPPPLPVTFDVEQTVLFHSESTVVSFFVNLKGATLDASWLTLNTGYIRNFRGANNRYTVEIVAPESGFGVIEMSIIGYPGVVEEIIYTARPTEDIVFVSRKEPVLHIGREDGVIYLEEITDTTLDSINDIRVLVLFSRDVTGFSEADLLIEAVDEDNDDVEAYVVEFTGKGSVYEAVIRVLSPGGAGKIVVTVPQNVTDQGNPLKSLTLSYSDEIIEPEWELLFTTPQTYNDIVYVDAEGVALLRASQIDVFGFDGTAQSDLQVVFPPNLTITRAVRYDHGQYIGLSQSNNRKAHFFSEGTLEWSSEAVWTLATDRGSDSASVLNALAVNDWSWTGEREIFLAAMPYQNNPAKFAKLGIETFFAAVREGADLNDVVFDEMSLNYAALAPTTWRVLVAIAAEAGRVYIGSNETSSAIQNYIFVFDAEGRLLPGQQIPIARRVKSLFVKDGYLYRYNDTDKALMRFYLEGLAVPKPKKEVYPQAVRPGDRIDLDRYVQYADTIVFDVGFEKPEWVSLDAKELVIAEDAPVDGTAYVRLRAINKNGATVAGAFGFYVYVAPVVRPRWMAFDRLSMYEEQSVNLHAFVSDAETIEFQEGFTPPVGFVLEGGVLRRTEN